MRLLAIFITAFLYITFCPAGAEVTLTPQGRLAIGSNITLEWRHNPAWQPIVIQGHPVLRNNTATLSGQCRFNGKLGADAEFSLTGIAENQWMYHATLYGIGATQHIYAEIKLPADNPTDVERPGQHRSQRPARRRQHHQRRFLRRNFRSARGYWREFLLHHNICAGVLSGKKIRYECQYPERTRADPAHRYITGRQYGVRRPEARRLYRRVDRSGTG